MEEYRVLIEQDEDAQSPREDFDNLGTMVCWHGRYTLGDTEPAMTPYEFRMNLAKELVPRFSELYDYWESGDGFDWLAKHACITRCEELERGFERGKPLSLEYLTRPINHNDVPDVIGDHLKNMRDAILAAYIVELPLFLYDHSGITMNTSGFHCPWDSGQVGFIYCTLADAVNWFLVPRDATWATKVRWGADRRIALCEAAEECLRSEVELYDTFIRGDVWGFVVEKRCGSCGSWEQEDSCWGYYGQDPEKNGMLENIDPKYRQLLLDTYRSH